MHFSTTLYNSFLFFFQMEDLIRYKRKQRCLNPRRWRKQPLSNSSHSKLVQIETRPFPSHFKYGKHSQSRHNWQLKSYQLCFFAILDWIWKRGCKGLGTMSREAVYEYRSRCSYSHFLEYVKWLYERKQTHLKEANLPAKVSETSKELVE